ncbi:FAD-dependent monooxygenase [Nesterenkonia populi]
MSELNVVISGAGIGGLSAAVALRRQGIRATVLEQAPQLGEVGTGLQLGPNATRVLYSLGLREQMEQMSLVVQESVQRRWDGTVLAKTTLGAYAAERYGTPYLQVHRADLHSALHQAAVDPAGEGPAADVLTEAQVTSIDEADPVRPAAVTAAGERHEADVILGADGIRSAVREHIGGPAEIVDSGDMAFRTLIDGQAVKDDPATRFLLDWQAANFWLGHNRHLVVYPIRGMSAINVVGVVPVSEQVAREWRSPSTSEDLVTAYDGFESRVRSLLSKPKTDPMLWALKRQDPFSRWSRGSIAILGDAAHAMVPYVSQGASQAIEDGFVVAEEISEASPDEIPAALKSYAARRQELAGFVQAAALKKQHEFHLPEGPDQEQRDAGMRAEASPIGAGLDRIYAGTPPRKGALTAS